MSLVFKSWAHPGRSAEQDMSPSGMRLTNTFDYNLKEDEVQLVWDRFIEKKLEIAVTDFSPGFGDRLRARGHLILPEQKKVA